MTSARTKTHIAILLSLCCLTYSMSSWPQNEGEQAENRAATEPDKPADKQTEGSDDKVKNTSPRLAGKLDRPRFPGNENKALSLLSNHYSDDALQWLQTEYGAFMGLWQKDRSGDPKGILLILHAEGEHPAWPNTTKALHDSLPDHGWATLAISLPLPEPAPQAKRSLPPKVARPKPNTEASSTDKDNEENDSKKKDSSEADKLSAKNEEQTKKEAMADNMALDEASGEADKSNQASASTPSMAKPEEMMPKKSMDAEVIAEKRLEAALKFLHDKGQFNVITLGSGVGAIRAQNFIEKITPKVENPKLKAKLERPIGAMIIVNGRNQLPAMDKPFQDWFNDPGIAVLDIYTSHDPRNQQDAKMRKTLALQKKVAIYKQVKLAELNQQYGRGENTLSRRVRSFLDANVTGVEVDNVKVNRQTPK